MKHLLASSLALLLFVSAVPAGAVTPATGNAVSGSAGSAAKAAVVDPTMPAGSWKFSKNMFFGMRNDPQVMELQEFLTDQGYYAGPVTGNYFLLTMQAVKKFQQANGVTPSGYFGILSRGKANTILERLVSFICPPEEGCTEPISVIPNPSLVINAESDLSAKMGAPFSAIFRVSGGSGKYYDIQGSGEVPGLTWTRNDCPPGVYCIKGPDPDSITLTGTPRKAGVYTVTVVAREDVVSPCKEAKVNAPCPLLYPMGKYGKAAFTVVVRGDGTVSSAPVVKGVKGPAELKVNEEGTWSIQATGKGSLSYSVTWGDEAMAGATAESAPRASMMPFVQTATFSHRYANSGVYTVVFKVADEQGNVASATLGVKVGEVLTYGGGTLQIDPAETVLAPGGEAKLMAYYQPPMPPCPTGFFCAQMMPPRIPVKAAWTSSDPNVVSIQEPRCTADMGVGACPNVVHVSAGQPGTATIVATYSAGGTELKAKAAVRVTGDAAAGTLTISPNVGDLKIGGSTSFAALYQAPLPPCARATSGPICMIAALPPYPVNAEWFLDNSSVASLAIAIADCAQLSASALPCRSFTSAHVTGQTPGTANLTAVFSPGDGSRVKASIPIRVSN